MFPLNFIFAIQNAYLHPRRLALVHPAPSQHVRQSPNQRKSRLARRLARRRAHAAGLKGIFH